MTQQKIVVFQSHSTPAEMGYNDKANVIDEQGFITPHYAASCCPNEYSPKTGKPWPKEYAFLAPIEYFFECIEHEKHGKCLLVNGGKECETRNCNINHDNLRIATQIFVHCGESDTWRGSAGCLTIHPLDWDAFMLNFFTWEKGVLRIIDCSKMGDA